MKSRRAVRLSVADLLLFSLLLRLYFFYVTREQAVWWDEAEYLLLGRQIAGFGNEGLTQDWRPIGLPLLLAGFFSIGLGESAIRLALVLTSLAAIWLTYRIGERIVGPTAAWVGAGLLSVCYLPLFYTFRILTETPHLTMSLLGVFLYLDGRVGRRWLGVGALVAATWIRFTDVVLLGLVAAHWSASAWLGRERAARRRLALGVAVALAAAVALAWVSRDELASLWRAWEHMVPGKYWSERWERFVEYPRWLLRVLGPVQAPLLVFGLAWWVEDARERWQRRRTIGGAAFLLAWMAVAVLPFAIFVKLHDRYLMVALPPIFLAVGHGAVQIVQRRVRESWAPLALVALVAAAALPMFLEANDLIHAKARTYAEVAEAGRWLRHNARPGERILANSPPQIAYYAARDAGGLPLSENALWRAATEEGVRHLVVSAAERQPAWLRADPGPRRVRLREVARFPRVEPSVVVYAVEVGGRAAPGVDGAPGAVTR